MTCAFAPCDQADGCALVGGCIRGRFLEVPRGASDLKRHARKLAGELPARTNRDPRFIQRKRKALR